MLDFEIVSSFSNDVFLNAMFDFSPTFSDRWLTVFPLFSSNAAGLGNTDREIGSLSDIK